MIADRLLIRALRSVRFCAFALLLGFSILPSRAVLVAWDPNPPSEGVEGYRVYYSVGGVTYGPIPAGMFTTNALPNLAPGVTHTIWVTAFNAAGESDPSESIQYTPPAGTPPSITKEPVGQSLIVGGLISLDVDADGTGPLKYDWFRGNTHVSGVSDTFSKANALISDSGNYVVRISNPIGAITSAVAVVTINAAPVAPSITLQPVGLSITEGAEARFTVQATGTAPLSYQWSNGDGNIPGANSASYVIPAAQLGDADTFRVRVSNSVGFVDSDPAVLTVLPVSASTPPTIQEEPVDLTAFEGEITQLTVTATGTGPLFYLWFKNDDVFSIQSLDPNLPFTPIGFGDAGDYYVVVSNLVGTATSGVVQVTVTPPPDDLPPIITAQPLSRTVTAGSIVEFAIDAISVGPLSYQWFKDGAPISGATSNPFRINAAALSDSGEYSVQVSNTAGLEISETAVLQVNAAPTILDNPVDVTVPVNGSASFTAAASGSGSILYQWYKGATQISGATAATFTIASAQTTDEGSYRVRITDDSGISYSAPAQLRVVTAPVILSQPTNVRIAEGLRAEFLVQASPEIVSYQWLKNGEPISGATAPSLVFSPAAYSNSGTYAVRVSNIAGEVLSSEALLEIAGAPRINGQTGGGVAHEGTATSFSVAVAGASPLTFRWFHNGSEISGPVGATLTLESPRKTDEGSYWVIISNEFGSVTSTAMELQVIEKPRIVEHPANVRLNEGGSATLRVIAEGPGPIQTQWYKNGTPLPAEQASTLTISAAALADAGTYHAIVANVAGQAVSQSATITVVSPPGIVEQPVGGEIFEGETLTLSVVAEGTPTLSYQWFKDENLVEGATSETLVIEKSTSETAGSYTVIISNEAGSITSGEALVSVFTGPRVVADPASTTVNEGSRSSFTLQAEISGSGNLAFQWFKDDVEIPGATSPSLTFSTVQRTDAGAYKLRVSNSAGTVFTQPALLTVLTAPVITLQPASVTILEGSQFSLVVSATGSDPLDFQWFRNGITIAGATSPMLTRSGAVEDAGIYSVRVANAAGSIVSEAAEVTVFSPPTFTSQSSDQTVAKGGTVRLSARARGTGPLSYQWHKNGSPVFGATTPNLLIFGADPTDSGIYVLYAMNAYGTNKSANVSVTVTAAGSDPDGTGGNEPGVLSIQSASGRLSISSIGETGDVFTLQSCGDLRQPLWQDVATAIMSSTGALEFDLARVNQTGAVFFRLSKQ